MMPQEWRELIKVLKSIDKSLMIIALSLKKKGEKDEQ